MTAPAPAPKQRASENGVQLGARLGYAIPVGDNYKRSDGSGDKLGDSLSSAIPIILDANYRVGPAVAIGLYLGYAFGVVNKDKNPGCDQTGVSCSANQVRLGMQAHFHLAPGATFDPWLGVGLGYEWLNFSTTFPGGTGSSSLKGLEYVNLQAGGDIAVMPGAAIGPFLSYTAGQFSTVQAEGSRGTSTTEDIASDRKATHGWLTFGLRAVVNL